MKYRYIVIKTESKFYPLGRQIDSDYKVHDGRTMLAELSDVDCNSFTLRFVGLN